MSGSHGHTAAAPLLSLLACLGAMAAPAAAVAGDEGDAPVVGNHPVVRLTGSLTRRGVRVQLLSIFGPRGAHIAVRCRGGGCPRGGPIRRSLPARGPRIVRVQNLRRLLRPGARIEVRVTKSGLVGKYTRFLVRRHGAPRRSDRCLPPGVSAPKECR